MASPNPRTPYNHTLNICRSSPVFAGENRGAKQQEDLAVSNHTSGGVDRERLIIQKSDISKIDLIVTDKINKYKKIKGSEVTDLKNISLGSYLFGSVAISNYIPKIKKTDFVSIKKGVVDSKISIIFASPEEIGFLMNLEEDQKALLKLLKAKHPEAQISVLRGKKESIERRISSLSRRGFYAHYSRIMKLNGEVIKIDSKVASLKLQVGTPAVIELEKRINTLAEGVDVVFNLWVY